MNTLLHRLRRSSIGAALVEYCILIGLIAVLVILTILLLGNTVRDNFLITANALSSNMAYEQLAEAETPAAGAEPISWVYNQPVTYPDTGDCMPVPVGGAYDPTYTCYLQDSSQEPNFDFSAATNDTFVTSSGTPPDDPFMPGPTILVGGSGDDVFELLLDGGGNMAEVSGGGGDNWISLPGNCADLMGTHYTDTNEYRITTGEGLEIIYDYSSMSGIYCQGDDTEYSNSDIDMISVDDNTEGGMYGGGGGDGGYPGSTG